MLCQPFHQNQQAENENAPATVLTTAPGQFVRPHCMKAEQYETTPSEKTIPASWSIRLARRARLSHRPPCRSVDSPSWPRPVVVGADYLGIGGVQDVGTPVMVRKRTQQPIAGPQDVPGAVATSSALSPRTSSRTIADGLQPDVGRRESRMVALWPTAANITKARATKVAMSRCRSTCSPRPRGNPWTGIAERSTSN